MNPTKASTDTKLKVGIFTILGLVLIGAMTVLVNDKPFWWRPCQLVYINVEDATGLKMKSPVRSLGLQIGYLRSVQLTETHVRLGICVTAPIEILSSTRAYIRGEGFLGDKFVELKPVRSLKSKSPFESQESEAPEGLQEPSSGNAPENSKEKQKTQGRGPSRVLGALAWLDDHWFSKAYAEPSDSKAGAKNGKTTGSRDIPVGSSSQDVQQLVSHVDDLISEMRGLTANLKEAIDPNELRKTMAQLNRALENAGRTLSPEGNLNTTAQRTLAKLEDAIEQLRDMVTRMNRGEGSVGMLLNDPSFAEQIRELLKNANKLISRVGGYRFVVDIGAADFPAFNGGRGTFQLSIWPESTRYYRLGITTDPRGKLTVINTTTTAGGVTTTTKTSTVEEGGLLLTAMLGKVFFRRLDLSLGALHGDGAVSAAIYLGPRDKENRLMLVNDVYSRGRGSFIQDRTTLIIRPYSGLYLQGGLETYKKVNGQVAYFYGAGVAFDDEDIKLLFAFR